jgi:deazaflavin-dependent oxidoreductase (nitroreductase family)
MLTPLAVRIGAIPWMPRLLPQITATDKFIQRVTRGRVTILDIAGLPNLMLTVKGRKSGTPRTTPLLCVPYESGNLIAGSNFGGEKKPVWVVNVRAAEEKGERVGVRKDGRTQQAAVRELTGAERDRAWEHMLETWPNYAKYEQRTDRLIPVFRLERIS